eukprot:scaffold4880_cov19-Tisochrysis_lutea.AAC.1
MSTDKFANSDLGKNVINYATGDAGGDSFLAGSNAGGGSFLAGSGSGQGLAFDAFCGERSEWVWAFFCCGCAAVEGGAQLRGKNSLMRSNGNAVHVCKCMVRQLALQRCSPPTNIALALGPGRNVGAEPCWSSVVWFVQCMR